MVESNSRKRPWLAALLGAFATGLGHLYLRQWRRAFGWLAALFGVSVLFVDPAAADALANGAAVDPLAVAPLLVVGTLSVADAYLLAHAQNAVARFAPAPDEPLANCPHCGGELDPDLDFCHWCTARVDDPAAAPSDGFGGRESY